MKSSINFYSVMALENKPVINVKSVVLRLIVMFLALVNIFGIVFCVLLNNTWKNTEAQLSASLASAVNIANEERSRELRRGILSAEAGIAALGRLEENVFSIKEFETEYYTLILREKPVSVTIESMSFATGLLRITCASPGEDPAAHFVRALEATRAFRSVSYGGFTSSGADGTVSFSITCAIREGR
jgi:hypothetical protein